MIWNDRMIKEWGANGGVTPFDGTLVNPASLDLRLGNTIRRPHPIWDRLSTVDIDQKIKDGTIDALPKWGEPVTFEIEYLKRFDFALLHSHEFVCIPTTAASALFLKSSKGRDGMNHSHCLHGDTLIDVPRDVGKYPKGIPIKDLVGKPFLAYSFDTNTMKFVLAPATAFPSRENAEVVKVTYEWMTGRKWRTDSIVCTPDHRFLTLDGRWVEAQNLNNERLQPFWRWTDGKYAGVMVDPLQKRTMREHRFVAEQVYDLGSMQVHHVNQNKLDNNPENLCPIESGVHQSIHSSGESNPFFGKQHTDEARQRMSIIRTGRTLSESHRRSMSRATSGENNPRYVDISLGQIVEAYRKTGKIIDAAQLLGIHEGTLLSKIKQNGFDGTVDFRKRINEMDNHKVIEVTSLPDRIDTFDMTVPDYENFVANGVVVHNSGWGDPGFGLSKANASLTITDTPTQSGAQWTFEIQNIAKWPIKLVAGAPVIQMVMMNMVEQPELDYRFTGRYVYQAGPTPERPEVNR